MQIGKLQLTYPFHHIFSLLIEHSIEMLPINFDHLQVLLSLEMVHRDPFDRITISQGISQKLTILTHDKNFKYYPINCIW